jgi:hypothetical protein
LKRSASGRRRAALKREPLRFLKVTQKCPLPLGFIDICAKAAGLESDIDLSKRITPRIGASPNQGVRRGPLRGLFVPSPTTEGSPAHALRKQRDVLHANAEVFGLAGRAAEAPYERASMRAYATYQQGVAAVLAASERPTLSLSEHISHLQARAAHPSQARKAAKGAQARAVAHSLWAGGRLLGAKACLWGVNILKALAVGAWTLASTVELTARWAYESARQFIRPAGEDERGAYAEVTDGARMGLQAALDARWSTTG